MRHHGRWYRPLWGWGSNGEMGNGQTANRVAPDAISDKSAPDRPKGSFLFAPLRPHPRFAACSSN
ncbi:MAG: hypothetical protein ACREMA_10525 [Longimicrobiales bacterium]